MEKSSSIRRKIIITAISALICILVIGVSVFAALTQTVNINNNITITTDGQTEVIVNVFEASNAAATAVDTAPVTEPSDWGSAVLTKDAATTSATEDLTPMDFSVSDGINYYAYKITFQNTGSTIAYAHISASAVNNAQLKIYAGESWASLADVGNNTAIDSDVTLAATDGTGEFYIVVASAVALENLNDMAQTPFNVTITIDQTAP